MCKYYFNLNIFFYFVVSFFIFSFFYLLGCYNQSCINYTNNFPPVSTTIINIQFSPLETNKKIEQVDKPITQFDFEKEIDESIYLSD